MNEITEWTSEDSERLRELAERATPEHGVGRYTVSADQIVFMEYARADIPRILDYIEALEAGIKSHHGEIARLKAENEKLRAVVEAAKEFEDLKEVSRLCYGSGIAVDEECLSDHEYDMADVIQGFKKALSAIEQGEKLR